MALKDIVGEWTYQAMQNQKNPGNIASNASKDIGQIFQALASLGDPRMTAILQNLTKDVGTMTGIAARGANIRGTRLGQDISASVGAIGAGGTGAGAIARGIGGSMASSQAAQAMMQGSQLLAEQRAQIQQQYLASLLGIAGPGGINTAMTKYQGDINLKIAKMQEPSWFEKFTGALGIAGGSLPWGQWFGGGK